MKNPIFPFTTLPGVGSKPLTAEQAAAIFTEADIVAGQKRGDLKTFGMWRIPVSYKALACDHNYTTYSLTVLGFRTLSKVRQEGHWLEGRVSVNGKNHRGLTSSCLFELPDGKLVNCAIIHVCKK